LLAFVDEDLQVAEMLLTDASPVLRSAAFHCQQAAEKMAKAVLVALGAAVPKIHDVEELSWLVTDVDPELGKAVGKLALGGWYAVRYPGLETDFQPSSQDVRSALAELRDLRERINSLAPKA